MATTCDGNCGKRVERADLVEVRIARPSDPSDLCCIMAGCADCFRPSSPFAGGCQAYAHSWDVYIESACARERGHAFIS